MQKERHSQVPGKLYRLHGDQKHSFMILSMSPETTQTHNMVNQQSHDFQFLQVALLQ